MKIYDKMFWISSKPGLAGQNLKAVMAYVRYTKFRINFAEFLFGINKVFYLFITIQWKHLQVPPWQIIEILSL